MYACRHTCKCTPVSCGQAPVQPSASDCGACCSLPAVSGCRQQAGGTRAAKPCTRDCRWVWRAAEIICHQRWQVDGRKTHKTLLSLWIPSAGIYACTSLHACSTQNSQRACMAFCTSMCSSTRMHLILSACGGRGPLGKAATGSSSIPSGIQLADAALLLLSQVHDHPGDLSHPGPLSS